MLSVTTATVHRAMCPSTPQNTTPERKERFWSCENNQISKRHCRPNTSRKNLSLRLTDPLELNVEVTSHSIPITPERTPKSKIPLPKISSNSPSTLKPRIYPVSLFKHEKSPTHHRCPNLLYKEASLKANDEASEDIHPKIVEKSIEIDEKAQSEDNEPKLDSSLIKNNDKSLQNSPALPRGKRKRGSESRMSIALKMLKTDDNDVDYTKPRPNLDSTISNSPSIEDEKIDVPVDDTFPVNTEFKNIQEQENWNSEENWNRFQQENWQFNNEDNWVNPHHTTQEIWHNPSSSNWDDWDVNANEPVPLEDPLGNIHPNESFYMTGFPNPPAENRCWLNATLQAIFALPLVDHLRSLDLNRCSELTRTLVAIQLFWREGSAEREKTYQTVTKFKGLLEILDESYSSHRQQDVSEFLMKLLNHVKTDCEKNMKEIKSLDETENVPDNSRIQKRSPTICKRPALTQISPFKNMNGSDASGDDQSAESSPKSQECEDSFNNPIDKYFLLPMMEHYVCQNCSKHRQRKVDNMMLYVDLPENETDPIELSDAIGKTLQPEDRTLTCDKCKYEEHKLYTSFRESPNVLIVQINRYGMSDGYVAKMNSIVHIPEVLQIISDESANGDIQLQKFVPVCVIAHVGSAMDCGHYTSYVKHEDQWFHYNDMSVTPMSTGEALTAAQTTAYLVFFMNTDILPKSESISESTMEEVSR